MQARCCCDPQNALVEEGCAIPALPCKLAAVVIHRMLWCKEGVLSRAVMLAAVVIHRMLWWKKCAILRCRKLAAVGFTECSARKGVLSLRCHACKLLS
jgi:hypothetical protein